MRSVALLCLWLVPAAARAQGSGTPPAKAAGPSEAVTSATGRSWLTRRGLAMSDASLGRIGDVGHAGTAVAALLPRWPWPDLQEHWVLTGADLYRLNCRSCHNADGTGLPPEINSVVDAVRATSAVLAQRRMEGRGHPIDLKTARDMARGAEGNLRQRFHQGGEKMPALPHLSEADIDSVLAYLGHLAAVPEAEHKELRVTLSTAQVGQHIVKGTCQVCHDATGAGSYPGKSASGKPIPSLASIVETKSVVDVIRKARSGSPTPEGGRGEMPLFPYLSDAELGAAYVYLVTHPPRDE